MTPSRVVDHFCDRGWRDRRCARSKQLWLALARDFHFTADRRTAACYPADLRTRAMLEDLTRDRSTVDDRELERSVRGGRR